MATVVQRYLEPVLESDEMLVANMPHHAVIAVDLGEAPK